MSFSFLFAGLLGGLTGLGEILGRHRDAPFSALRNWATVLLTAIYAAASIITLAIIRESGLVTLPTSLGAGAEAFVQILVAGVGAMAILRVGLSIQISGETINISFSNLLQPLLRAANDEIDRARVAKRLAVTRELMSGMNVEVALRDLPPLCLSLMQSILEEDQKKLAEDVRAIKEQNTQNEYKLINLGSVLLNVVGENVLRSAVGVFKDMQQESYVEIQQHTPARESRPHGE